MSSVQRLFARLTKALDDLQDAVTDGDELEIKRVTGICNTIYDRLKCEIKGVHGKSRTNWDGYEGDLGSCDECGCL